MAILKMTLREFDVAALMSIFTQSDSTKTFTIMVEESGDKRRKSAKSLSQLKTVLSKICSSKGEHCLLPQDHAAGMLEFVFARWHYWNQQGVLDPPYAEHATCLLQLLQKCRESKTEAEQRHAASNVMYFVMLNSCGKMLQRLELGVHGSKYGDKKESGKRWLFDIITKPIGAFPRRAHSLPCVDRTPTEAQSDKQRRTLVEFWKSQDFETHTQNAVRLGPIYDVEGRKRFHCMLSRRLLAVRKELEELQILIEEIKATPKGNEQPETIKGEIRTAVHRLLLELRGLTEIQLEFRQILHDHLKWLSQVTGATFAHHEPAFSEEEHCPFPQMTNETEGLTMPFSADSVYCNLKAAEEDEMQIESRGDPRNLPKEAMQCDQWANIAKEYLLLISDHDLRIINAVWFKPEAKCPIQDVKTMSILSLEINVITADGQGHEEDSLSLDKCLRRIVKKSSLAQCGEGKALDYPKLKGILDEVKGQRPKQPCYFKRRLAWLSGSSDKISNTISGSKTMNPHCEAFAMALSACLNDSSLRKAIIDSCTSEKCASDHDGEVDFYAVRFVTVKHLRASLPAVQYSASRRCCPACWMMVRIANAMLGDITVIHPSAKPGDHTGWSKIDLPVWMPRRLGLEMIKEMEAEAAVMLRRAQVDHDDLAAVKSAGERRKALAQSRVSNAASSITRLNEVAPEVKNVAPRVRVKDVAPRVRVKDGALQVRDPAPRVKAVFLRVKAVFFRVKDVVPRVNEAVSPVEETVRASDIAPSLPPLSF